MPKHILGSANRDGDDHFENIVTLDAMRRFDWATSSVGAIESWPEALKHAVRLVLHSAAPMAALLGRDGLVACNGAMREMLGSHYDGVLGLPVSQALPGTASFFRRAIEQCFEGKGLRFRDEPIRLYRNGEESTAWFHLDFTPIASEHGNVFGVLLVTSEATERVRALRDLRSARERMEIALDAGGIVGTWDFDVSTQRLTSDERFARLFGISAKDAQEGIEREILANVIHSDDRAYVKAALERAISSGSDYKCRYRVVAPKGRVRWYFDTGRALLDADGHAIKLSGLAIDLTDQVSTAEALAESEMRFEALAESIPQIVWSTDAYGRHDYFNRRWNEFIGLDAQDVTSDTWIGLVHPDDFPTVSAIWEDCLATGKPYDIEYRCLHYSGVYRWLRVMALPLRDRLGQITRWYGTSTDIEDAKHLDAERELVANELDHRIKNVFAVVNSLIALSVRDDPGMVDLANILKERLRALHTAHDLLRSRQVTEAAHSLHALARALLKPYDGRARILLTGDNAEVSQSQLTPLALVFHELATNSAKYGALGDPDGALHLNFTRDGGQMQIEWKETGLVLEGQHPDEGGFGSRLLSLTIERQLRGSLSRVWEATGLTFRLEVPFGAEA